MTGEVPMSHEPEAQNSFFGDLIKDVQTLKPQPLDGTEIRGLALLVGNNWNGQQKPQEFLEGVCEPGFGSLEPREKAWKVNKAIYRSAITELDRRLAEAIASEKPKEDPEALNALKAALTSSHAHIESGMGEDGNVYLGSVPGYWMDEEKYAWVKKFTQ